MGHSAAGRARRAAVAGLATLAFATGALAVEPPPDGFGKARFRMSLEEVKALYPDGVVKQRGPEAVAKAQKSDVPLIAFLELEGQTVLGMEGCSATLQFAADQFYFVHVNCGSDEKIEETLREHFGDPVMMGGVPYWIAEKHGVSMNPNSKVFGFYDRKMDKLVQGKLREAVARSAGQ